MARAGYAERGSARCIGVSESFARPIYWHTRLESTTHYLRIEADDALAIAAKIDNLRR
jgi:hypothetical protein